MLIRPFDGDYAALAQLLNQVNSTPITAAALAEDDRRLPAGVIRQRMVALDPSGRLSGYGLSRWMPWEHAGHFTVRAVVAPDSRHQGIGSALVAAGTQFALDQGATAFHTFTRDDDAESEGFIRRRGFALDHHLFSSTLDVTRFAAAAFADVVPAVTAAGIRFSTLAAEPGEATERALYEVDKQSSRDNPGEDLPESFLTFEEWKPQTIHRQGVRPDLVLFACDGDRFVGMTALTYDPDTHEAYTGYTGVLREYRGRSIALALKVLSIDAARRVGATHMRTENDSRNAPMLAVNRRLGYVPGTGTLHFRRKA